MGHGKTWRSLLYAIVVSVAAFTSNRSRGQDYSPPEPVLPLPLFHERPESGGFYLPGPNRSRGQDYSPPEPVFPVPIFHERPESGAFLVGGDSFFIFARAKDEPPSARIIVDGAVEARRGKTELAELRCSASDSEEAGVPPLEEQKKFNHVIQSLSDPDYKVRANALEVIVQYGGEAAEKYVMQALHDPDDWVRQRAVEFLGLGYCAQRAVPALAMALRDEIWQVRALAAMSLGSLGKEAKGAVFNLLLALKDDHLEVRAFAARALGEIGDATVVPFLIQTLNDEDKLVRWISAQSIGKFGRDAKDAVSPLMAALDDNEPEVRREGAEALGQIGPPAASAIPQLEALLNDAAWMVQCKAAYALWRIEGKEWDAVSRLTKILKHGDVKTRCTAASCLGEMGPRAIGALPALVAALRDYEPDWSSVCGGFPTSPSIFAAIAIQRIAPLLGN